MVTALLPALSVTTRALEPHVPRLLSGSQRLISLRIASTAQGVALRPNNRIEHMTDELRNAFARIASELKGATTRVVTSVVDFYGKVHRNLKPLERAGWRFQDTRVQSLIAGTYYYGWPRPRRSTGLRSRAARRPEHGRTRHLSRQMHRR